MLGIPGETPMVLASNVSGGRAASVATDEVYSSSKREAIALRNLVRGP